MGIYEPKSCCICFDTKTGSLILGTLSLIGAILLILQVVYHLFIYGVSDAFLVSFHVTPSMSHMPSVDPHDMCNIFAHVCIAVLFHVLYAVCACLLIHGIRKDRPGLMLPKLVLQRCLIFISIILITILFCTCLASYQSPPREIIINLLRLIILTSIVICCHLVYNAYHKQLKRALSEDHSILQEESDIDANGFKIKV